MSANVSTFTPSGRLDGEVANELRQNILNALKEEVDIILLDLEAVSFMNSSAIGALIATKKAVHSAGKQLYICSVQDQVQIIFELTRMDQVLQPFADRTEFETKVLGQVIGN